MNNIKFYSKKSVPLEMHKAKIVQKIKLPSIEERYKKITEAGNNTFQLKGLKNLTNINLYDSILSQSGGIYL